MGFCLQPQDSRSYYNPNAYRPHVTGVPASGDSTLARALAGRSPSALAPMGMRDPSSSLRESASNEPLRRLVLTPSRSRDLMSAMTGDPSSGRITPTSTLLNRLSASSDKDDLLLRKDLLPRSLLRRDQLSRESLKDEIDEKTEQLTQRLRQQQQSASSLLAAGRLTGGGVGGTTPTGMGTSPSATITAVGTTSTTGADGRSKLLTINPSEFVRYKIERPASSSNANEGPQSGAPLGHSGILRVHLLAGRALRSTVRNTDASARTRDLYCVLECDRVHKARTVVCTGDQNFDWDEVFELDLVNNKELDFLIYSWDPQLRHRLCYKGSVNLMQVLCGDDTGASGLYHQLAIKVEPRGTLYVKLYHTAPQDGFKRELKNIGLFGADLATVVMKEDSGLNVPLIVQRCIEEIERRGLDIIGLYRLCGSAMKKQTLRDAFERNPRVVDLSAENVPDINVITGKTVFQTLEKFIWELGESLIRKVSAN